MLIRPNRRSINALWILAICVLLASGAWLFTPAQHAKAADAGDNYPTQWRDPVPQDSTPDTWGEYNRECTSWASWALHDRNGYEIPFHDYAGGWGADATAKGFSPNSTPAAGSIAWWNYGAAGASSYGHVAWVASVSSDATSIVVEEYNFTTTGEYDTRTITKTGGKWPSGFIHFKDLSTTPPPVPWSFENLEGGTGAVSPHVGNVGMTPATAAFNGQLYVFYYDKDNGDLRVAYTHPNWLFDIVDGAGGSGKVAGDVGQVPSTVVFNNVLYTFYYDSSNGNLRMASTSNGTSWQTTTMDGDLGSLSGYNANVGQTPSVVVSGTSLHVFYYQSDQGVLRHAWSSNGSSWGFETLDGNSGSISHFSGNVGLDASAIAYNGTIQLFYSNLSQGDLRHAWADGSGWHFENLDGDAGSVGHSGDNVGGNPTAFVFQSNLGVLYYDRTQHTLRHAWSDASGWHFEVMLGTGSVLGYSSSDIGTASTVVVNGSSMQAFVYEAGGGNLVHLWNDGSWHAENLDGAGGQPSSRIDANVGLDPAAIMFGTTLNVFYYDADHGALRHAWPN